MIDMTPVTKLPAKDVTQFFEPIKYELGVVETWLQSNLIDDNPFVKELLSQVFKSGGKRIRPGLVLLSSRATSPNQGELSRLHIILAVLTELIHTASLVHDDVIDKASLRRGQETVNTKWNDKVAVLIGDLLFAQASICLSRLMNPAIVGIYGQVLGDLCAGEIRQMRQQFNCQVDWNAYIQKSISKTATLFSAGTHSGAILNASSDSIIGGLKTYGLNFGICFQIVDDLLDITGNTTELGKKAGSDLAQGVITAPALFILERNDRPASRLKELITTRQVMQEEGTMEALALIREHGGIEATIKLCHNYAKTSQDSLYDLPSSIYKDSLMEIVDYLLTRTS